MTEPTPWMLEATTERNVFDLDRSGPCPSQSSSASSPMVDFVEIICGPCKRAPKKVIAYSWFLSMLLAVIIFIIACVTANKISAEDRAMGFAIVWTALLCILISIGGTLVMKKYLTPIALGYLLGCVIVMAQQCLILTAVFGGLGHSTGSHTASSASTTAASVFLFFLFTVYAFFGTVLSCYRKVLEEGQFSPELSTPVVDPTAQPN